MWLCRLRGLELSGFRAAALSSRALSSQEVWGAGVSGGSGLFDIVDVREATRGRSLFLRCRSCGRGRGFGLSGAISAGRDLLCVRGRHPVFRLRLRSGEASARLGFVGLARLRVGPEQAGRSGWSWRVKQAS